MIKIIPLLCFILLIAGQSMAQHDPDRLFYAQKVEKYRKMKNTGVTLTVTGAILYVVGISMILNSANTNNSTQATTNSNAETGALVYLLGVGSLGAGIPLWIVGGHQQGKYERKFENISVGFNVTPQKTGLTLRYRF